jgi:MATE family multidrug resistance protein
LRTADPNENKKLNRLEPHDTARPPEPVEPNQLSAMLEKSAGGSRELLRVAAPLVVSSSFFTIQMTVDRLMLSEQSSAAVAAAMSGAVWYWTPLALLQYTAMYTATFVAQYFGAGQFERIGPAVWQGIYFSIAAGVAFLAVLPGIEPLVRWIGHAPDVQDFEIAYLECLSFATLPFLLVATVNSFFSGRGETWRVMLIDGIGAMAAIICCYLWINGRWGFPALGIRGAGWAVVVGNWCAVAVAFAMMMQRKFRQQYRVGSGWRLDLPLLRRMMRYGLPNGLQYGVEALAFSVFLVLVGWLDTASLSATSIVFTINAVAVVPMLGLGQAVSVLTGQRLGANRPDIAARTVRWGLFWCLTYTALTAAVFLLFPQWLGRQFRDPNPSVWQQVEPLIPVLLRFVCVYCLFESISVILSSALRGAGDTRFVSAVTLVFSWSVMVVPTFIGYAFGAGLTMMWTCATAYLVLLSFVFAWRYRGGKWRAMRVIELKRRKSTNEASA